MTLTLEGIRREMMRQSGVRPRGAAPKPIPFDSAVRTEYFSELREYLRDVDELIQSEMPNVSRHDQHVEGHEEEDDSSALLLLLGAGGIAARASDLRIRIRAVFADRRASRTAMRIAMRLMERFDPRFADQMARAGVLAPMSGAMPEAVQLGVAENVALIKDIGARAAAQVEAAVVRAARTGQSRAQLAQEIAKIMNTTERRALLIANDQTAKLQGTLNRARQTALGITHYRWVTMGDDRVRPKHRALHNTIQAWASPPSVGHPGEDYNCRCVAVPVVRTQ